jgi:hypothetical protein
MINSDDFVKIVLAISVAFAIVGISIQLMRLLSKLSDIFGEAKKPVSNLSTLSDYLLEDYNDLRKYIKSLLGLLEGVSSIFKGIKPLKNLSKLLNDKETEDIV